MITLLTGANSFEIERELVQIIAGFNGNAEKIDGAQLELRQLPDLLMGGTLFADKRLIIIKNLSENTTIWSAFSDWIEKLSSDVTLVLVDSKPDKRTTTFKALQKQAKVLDFPIWTEKDSGLAQEWVVARSKELGFSLDTKSAQVLVRRVGVDQWQLFHALEKLTLVPVVNALVIEEIIDASPNENVFNLFDAALRGDGSKVVAMLNTLELTEEPYRLFALLSGQAFQLAVVTVAGTADAVAKDFGMHPYVVSKLKSVNSKFGRADARRIISVFAKADDDIKISRGEPWLVIERTLLSIGI